MLKQMWHLIKGLLYRTGDKLFQNPLLTSAGLEPVNYAANTPYCVMLNRFYTFNFAKHHRRPTLRIKNTAVS